ncbi:arsenical pump-driving ATPase [Inhella gelatinilytica]|uniref:Arsenical pump-driving ATPase n=1 Tax=Inhella gelatinilytica TaxID=2795030 RepID=A0A931ISK6_9BURK|nr:arsenical pump-driving ATPase [Inhella gelatinilytica]MBH9551920.1 arsenical pump-driving ATPase [Inhella gelatinilytica]
MASTLDWLQNPQRLVFFTGKGGVGKTSLACASALHWATQGQKVLLVSTDPASNLDEMLGIELCDRAQSIPDAPGLWALNINPETAAEQYRQRVLGKLDDPADQLRVREQLSGACTTEIAAFDEFVGLLADDHAAFDRVVFDTAPTGHTLRLLSLPQAWSGFLAEHEGGASCLGPHSGLKMQEQRFRAAFRRLTDPAQTVVVLVTRADLSALLEASRSHSELVALGLAQQHLVVNGVFRAEDPGDPVAQALRQKEQAALRDMPAPLARLPQDQVELRDYDMVGLPALRALLEPQPPFLAPAPDGPLLNTLDAERWPPLSTLVDELAQQGHGLIMVMGKGGVGKTTVAAALALGLVQRGHAVHLTTTDPAAHVKDTLGEAPPAGLRVDRIDPKAETEAYIHKVLSTKGQGLSAEALAFMEEDLRSPCTEEVAVFHAFSRTVAEARHTFVVMDTAPTGHTLLLMDATGAYHRQMAKELGATRFVTPLMRLQDPQHTQVILVTLAETTPISEACALQDDLRRAKIEPWAWVVNRTLSGSGTRDPLLQRRQHHEVQQLERVAKGMANRRALVPWQAVPPVGSAGLSALLEPRVGAEPDLPV